MASERRRKLKEKKHYIHVIRQQPLTCIRAEEDLLVSSLFAIIKKKKGGRSFPEAKAQKVSESSEIRDENKEEKMLRLVENALSCRARGENRQNIIFACFLLHDDTLKKYFTSAHKK